MASPGALLFRGLPAYLGGKRRLCPLIFATLVAHLPRESWAESRFLDPFSGGGSVALCAKALGFDVSAADCAERALVVARALIANSNVRLRREDVLDLFHHPPETYPREAERFVPSVFTAVQAQAFDRFLARARLRPEPVRSLLTLVVIKALLRSQPMSQLRGTDARAAATGDYDRVSPRRLAHYLQATRYVAPDALWQLAQDVNASVVGGRGAVLNGDAVSVLSTTDAGVAYLDPPYAQTTAYDHEYAPLDALLRDAGEHPSVPTLDELLDAAASVPLVLLSYGGPSVTLASLEATVARHRSVLAAHAIPYRHLGSIASEEKNASNREYLILSRR
jgi:hypothetical protein